MKTSIIEYNDYAAMLEGWALFECDDGILRIQRLDCPNEAIDTLPEQPMFDNDDKAIEYVSTKAREGSEMHRAALKLHNCLSK